MKIIIFGATGGIGQHVVKYAIAKGHEVTVYVRNPEKIKSDKVKIIEGELSNYNKIREALVNQEAVIWCVGIPMKRKYDKMESLEGHKNLINAMNECGVKRLVDWGTPSVPFEKDKRSFITVVPGIMAGIALTRAKEEMVAIAKLISDADIDWTMVRFMSPNNSKYKGTVKVGYGDIKMSMGVSREDIAAFMVEQLESDKFIKSMPIIGS